MKLALLIAAGAALIAPMALVSPVAAQRVCLQCASHIPTGNGSGGGDSYSPGEPFNPFDRAAKDGSDEPGGPGDNLLKKLPGYVAGLPVCKTELGGLSKVRASAIDRVEHGVTVVAICTDKNLMDQQNGIPSIRSAIHDNDTMRKALRDAGAFSANDVVAVVLDGEGAKLYVHRARGNTGSLGSEGGGGSGEAVLKSQF